VNPHGPRRRTPSARPETRRPAPQSTPLVVYKLGGSLLELDDLGRRLAGLFQMPPPLPARSSAKVAVDRVVLVGGGRAADVVRQWDRCHGLSAEQAHNLALAAMALNARLVHGLLLPDSKFATEWRTSRIARRRTSARSSLIVLDPTAALGSAERQSGQRLPRSWDVTSDSIGAFLALHMQAAALVLVKSRPRPRSQNVQSAARRGLVDPYFPCLALRLPLVAWANLRAPRPAIERWL
jgi:5-(aminomethyl)-3-furanmethanol phosphate kinase